MRGSTRASGKGIVGENFRAVALGGEEENLRSDWVALVVLHRITITTAGETTNCVEIGSE